MPDAIGQAGAGGVIDRPEGAAVAIGAPARAHRRPAEHERIDGQGARPEQPGGREAPYAGGLEVGPAARRVVEVGGEQERERLARLRIGVEGVEQASR